MHQKLLSLFAVVFLIVFTSNAQQNYSNNREVAQRLQQMASLDNAKLISLIKTEGGHDIWALQIGTGDLENKPAIAITGGVEGYYVLSVELALQVANRILKNHSDLLDSTTFYVFPDMSPDAYAQYFSNLKYERRGNSVRVDQDRDGNSREDGYEDLNNDGYITKVRVESVMGDYVQDEGDIRLLKKSDKRSQAGKKYIVFSEGIDNDQDEKFNEDPEEGIAFNKSLTYKFPAFKPFAGEYPVSQKESRALLDYLFERWNIFAFVTFGPANNLSTPLKYNKSEAEKRIITSMLEKDVEINKMVSDVYKETVPLKAYNQDNQGTDGDFFQWAYFHFGRLSFSTPGWWVPEVKQDVQDSTQTLKGKVSPERNFLSWADKEGVEGVFLPWTEVKHPAFPNQKVEIGGIKPFVMTTPPYRMVDSLAAAHTEFIVKLAKMQPNLELHNLKTEELSGGLTRITVDVFNNSPLPTHSEMGEKSRWLQKLQVTVSRDKKEILAGDTIKLLDNLGAYEKKNLSWIVKGKGTVTIKVGAPHAGFATMNVKL